MEPATENLVTPNPLQPNGYGGVVSDDQTPVPFHTHDGVNSPKLNTGGVAGNNMEVQYNDNGTQAGDPYFRWDKNNAQVLLGSATDGIDAFIQGPNGAAASDEDGTNVKIFSGTGDGSGDGGNMDIFAGDAGLTGDGGSSTFAAGNGGSSSGDGGDLTLQAGSASSGNGGTTFILAGGGVSGNGGNVTLSPGAGDGSGKKAGDVIVRAKVGTNSADQGRFVIYNNSNAASQRIVGQIQTTDATPTTYKIATTNAPSSLFIEARVTAGRTGGTSGTDGDSAAYIRRALYRRASAGAPTLVGSIQDGFTAEDQAGWDATLVISSNDIQLQVTGAANNNINWRFEIFYISSKSGIF